MKNNINFFKEITVFKWNQIGIVSPPLIWKKIFHYHHLELVITESRRQKTSKDWYRQSQKWPITAINFFKVPNAVPHKWQYPGIKWTLIWNILLKLSRARSFALTLVVGSKLRYCPPNKHCPWISTAPKMRFWNKHCFGISVALQCKMGCLFKIFTENAALVLF